ncbi:MAG: hypothetical protein K2K74_16820 [Lachnospiraceae bacterium]|nr:hypothetical protein [Lachnospiraceae bacterium]
MSSQYVCGNNTKVFVCNDKVSVCLSETEISLSEAETDTIRKYWKEVVNKNPNLFDGVVLSVKSVEKLSHGIKIELEKTRYSHMTYVMNHTNENITKCRAVAVGGSIVTLDGYYVFGKMSKHTSFPDVIQCIGGGLSEEDIFDGDPVHTFLRECREEIGLTDEDIVSIDNKKYIYIRENQSTVGICYIAKIGLTKETLLQRFEETVTDGEIASLVFVNETYEAMSDLLMQQSLVDYAKVIVEKQLLDKSFDDIREYDFE